MSRKQLLSFLVFVVAACLFAYSSVNFSESLNFFVALIPVVFIAILIHVIFYDRLFLMCADEPDKGPINATHSVKNCMLMNAISVALVIVSLGFLFFTTGAA